MSATPPYSLRSVPSHHSFLLALTALSPPQRFVEHKTHILGFKPVSYSEGKQRL
uniref:Uncharacterized protein n=1 Tax=Arundo donax TaxID=35708 RepID=A0A0A9BUB6_ARUDO